MLKTTRFAAMALAAATFPFAVQAQADEAEQIQQRVMAVQQQAIDYPEVQAAQQELTQTVVAAMVRLEPEAGPRVERAEELQQEVVAAQAAGDNERLHALAEEAQELQAYFAALQPRVLEDPAVQEQQQVFTGVLFERMKQIDPEVEALVARLDEIRGPGSR